MLRNKSCFLLALLIMMMPTIAVATSYNGDHSFDGTHRNEVSGYVVGGSNVITGTFVGFEASYVRHLSSHWRVGGDAQMQFCKQLYSIDATAGYCLPVKYGHLYLDGKVMYNRYNRWNFNETIINLSATWESAYVDFRLGESLIHYQSVGDGYTEPLTLTFGIGANIRHRTNPWNIGLFFRNYDDFYYENWNINWGIRWYAPLPHDMRLFGEFNIRPAGSMSQLATKYEGSVKLGIKYKW